MAMTARNCDISLADIKQAAVTISDQVVRTPLLPSASLSKELGGQIYLKAENLQHEGSFKIRGATNALISNKHRLSTSGVIAHSSGNHAAALARASRKIGINANLVMPHNSSPRKISAVENYGIAPILCEPSSEARQATTDEWIKKTGALLIHAYDDPAIIAGQGTVGLEILEQLSEVDSILVPVGGGGLLSGVLLAAKAIKPSIQVWGCEPSQADDAYRSLQFKSIQMPTRYDTVADGLRTALGHLTFPIIQRLIDGILLVNEDEIMQATRKLATDARLVAEPSGAVTLAAMIRYQEQFRGKTTALVISGGNIDFSPCLLGRS
jgi:threonine dehydratase